MSWARKSFTLLRRPALMFGGLPPVAVVSLVFALNGILPGGAEPELPPSNPGATTQAVHGGQASSSSLQELAACPECTTPAVATTTSTPTPEPTATSTATPEPTATATPPPTPTPAVAPFAVEARAVAILDASCGGTLLYGKSEHEPLPPASLTKIVTALAAINHVDLADTVVSDVSAKELKARNRSSVMGLEPGQRVTVEDLLFGLFLPSGNDAAIMLAKHVSGSEEAFAALMNETARNIGMANSAFDNPHGLDSPGLRSSAYDMAIAGMALMQNPTLASIAGSRTYTLESGLSFRNGNKLLTQYPGAYGVKIGNTRDAGLTIVGAAERGGRHLYISVFDSDDLYGETSRLLDWAFTLPSPCAQ